MPTALANALTVEQQIRPKLAEPFPRNSEFWVCPKTNLKVPKEPIQNMRWRRDLLKRSYNDPVMQHDLLVACQESKLFWVNAFCWTFHQWDVNPKTGKRTAAKNQHVPFVTWEVQDDCFNMFDWCLENGEDILVNKSRDMGASWCCMAYIHWNWLFTPYAQMLEMSRTKEYVDQTANMKALFPKHDYMNRWLPWWMKPPECLPEQKNRSCMHLYNELNLPVLGHTRTGQPSVANAVLKKLGDRHPAVNAIRQ